MLFNSWQFAVFLPIVFISYWALPHRFRWVIMLLASYYFYISAGAEFVALLILTTVISYGAAIYIEKTDTQKKKKGILVISIIACLMGLAIFKYLNFFFNSITNLLAAFSIQLHPITLKFVLPLGISFYSFNVISYIIDVYRGKISAERHIGIYALYVSYFPKMLAGPIERAGNLIPQIKEEHSFDCEQGIAGLKQILWGLFKKIVVADTLVIYVDAVFNNITQHNGFALVLAAVFFSIQIYCDFSGYSDMARGVSRLMGIELMDNFHSPYFSSSIKDFWSRWHISLSTWFRDYVYIPLGGNRVKKPKQYFNLLATFLVSGLWHGANWTFVLWGGLHGVAQVLEKLLGIKAVKKKGSLRWLARAGLVFVFTTAAWVFFRADSFSDARYLFANMFYGISVPVTYLKQGFDSIGMTMGGLINFIVFMIPLTVYDFVSARFDRDAGEILAEKNSALQWALYVLLGLLVVFLSQKGVAAEFVYMQF